MKTPIFPLFIFLVLIALFSCDPCPEGMVRISEDTESYPKLAWTVETGSRHTPGISTALTVYTDPETEITLSGNDTIWVRLEARDEVNGIKSLDVQGGFGVTCSSDTSAIVLDGLYPSAPENNPMEGSCAKISHTFSTEFVITGTGFCNEMHPNLTSGGWVLNGSATNHLDFASASSLRIVWAP